MTIFSRVMAATFGGYLLANVAAITLSYLLPHLFSSSRADGVMLASFVCFFIYAAAVIWVFTARTVGRAWLGLLLPSLVCGALMWLLYPQASL
ncbi:MAG: DUF3649 domain-containing protein [Cycloclasticus sp.]